MPEQHPQSTTYADPNQAQFPGASADYFLPELRQHAQAVAYQAAGGPSVPGAQLEHRQMLPPGDRPPTEPQGGREDNPPIADEPRGGGEDNPPIADDDFSSLGKIVMVGLGENIRSRAVDASEAELNRQLARTDGNRITRFLRRAWRGGMARDYYETRGRIQAEDRIVAEQNLLAYENMSPDEYRSSTLRRFERDFTQEVRREDVIHEAAGERHETLTQLVERGDERARALQTEIYSLMDDYVNGRVTDDDFREREARMMNNASGEGATGAAIGDARLYVSNMRRIADVVRGIASRRNMNAAQILDRMDIVIGQARIGARREQAETRTERIYNLAERMRVARVLPFVANEAVIAGAVSGLAFLGKSAASAGAHTTLAAAMLPAALLAPGLAGGVYAGFREARAFRREAEQHEREVTEGRIDTNGLTGRRVDLERSRALLEQRVGGEGAASLSMLQLTQELGRFYTGNTIVDGEGHTILNGNVNITSDAQLQEAYNLVAEIRARVRVSDTEGRNLLHFSGMEGVTGSEREDLDVAVATTECALRRLLADPTFLAGTGNTNAATIRGPGFDASLTNQIDTYMGALSGHIAASNARFTSDRNSRVIRAVRTGTVVGAGAGVLSMGLEFGAHTLASGIGIAHAEAAAVTTGGHTTTIDLSHQSTLTVPDGFHGSISHDTMTITGPHGFKPVHVPLRSDGSLPASTRELLAQHHVHVSSTEAGTVKVPSTETHHNVSARELVNSHKKDTIRVRRDWWFANNENERIQQLTGNQERMDWGGINGTGFDSHGNIHFTINRMTPGQSFQGSHSVNPLHASREGKVILLLSADKNTQGTPFVFHFKGDDVMIPKNSPAYHLFGRARGWVRNDKGELVKGWAARYNGDLAETALRLGKHGGITDVAPLATVVGHAHHAFTNVMRTNRLVPVNHYTISIGQGNVGGNGGNLLNDIRNLFPWSTTVVPRDGITPPNRRQPEGGRGRRPGSDDRIPPRGQGAGQGTPPPTNEDHTPTQPIHNGRQPGEGQPPSRPTAEQFRAAIQDPNAPNVDDTYVFFNPNARGLENYSDGTKQGALRVINLARNEVANAFNRAPAAVMGDENLLPQVFAIAQREVIREANRDGISDGQRRQALDTLGLVNQVWTLYQQHMAANNGTNGGPSAPDEDDNAGQPDAA